jgi:hypothetical protein
MVDMLVVGCNIDIPFSIENINLGLTQMYEKDQKI